LKSKYGRKIKRKALLPVRDHLWDLVSRNKLDLGLLCQPDNFLSRCVAWIISVEQREKTESWQQSKPHCLVASYSGIGYFSYIFRNPVFI
jgi:hypothetical protein